jgi:hypothetical protein
MSAVETYGRLTVVETYSLLGKERGLWGLCTCLCKGFIIARMSAIRCGKTRSCGCLRREAALVTGAANTTHGKSSYPEYTIWKSMRQRCLLPTSPAYSNYGGRGVTVCPEWSDFNCFLADMGRRPSGEHSLDRIDNNGNYTKDNCRWGTATEQSENRRNVIKLTYQGKTQSLTAWSRELGVNKNTLNSRYHIEARKADVADQASVLALYQAATQESF